MPDDDTRAAIDALAGDYEDDEFDGDDVGDQNEAAIIKDLIEELAKFDIILPEDTDDENFFERLQVGLKTAAAHQGLDEDEGDGMQAWDNDTTVADAGGVAMMSLQVKGVMGYAERQHRDAVAATLTSLLKSGRCTPAEYHDRKQGVESLRLSLDEQGNAAPTDLEKWIASRQPLPRGTFWDEEEKSKRMSVEVEEPPEELTGTESDAKVNAVMAAVFGPRK
ncbi:MAG: hypothetical protein H8E44_04360 [Planctomycetes bacterium]|nr:hypothetical protein [Planctomycetota bacterium]